MVEKSMWSRAIMVMLALCTCPAGIAEEVTVRVVDGDTLRLDRQIVRLYGIDAPEQRQLCRLLGRNYACGLRARDHLRSLISGKSLECRAFKDFDRYGRNASRCLVEGADLAYQMVLAGWALDDPRYSAGHYSAPEQRARILRRGVWGGDFVQPWEWRRRWRQTGP